MTDTDWFIAIRPDGMVVEVGGGAPVDWVGHWMDALDSAPAALRSAAMRLMAESKESNASKWLTRMFVPSEASGVPDAQLLLVEAVPLRRSTTSLQDLLVRTTELLMSQATGTEVTLDLVLDDALPAALHIDAEKVAWGVATLVGNALRHATSTGQTERRVQVSARYDTRASEVVIAVQDNGPGIPNEKLRWLLERNPQTHRLAGLALVVLNDVMVAHGGRMKINSSTAPADHGTTVHLLFPDR